MNLFEFASAMMTELQRNSYKGGWHHCSDAYLLRRLRDEVNELEKEARRRKGRNTEAIVSEAADVANFAMMIADNASRKGQPDEER